MYHAVEMRHHSRSSSSEKPTPEFSQWLYKIMSIISQTVKNSMNTTQTCSNRPSLELWLNCGLIFATDWKSWICPSLKFITVLMGSWSCTASLEETVKKLITACTASAVSTRCSFNCPRPEEVPVKAGFFNSLVDLYFFWLYNSCNFKLILLQQWSFLMSLIFPWNLFQCYLTQFGGKRTVSKFGKCLMFTCQVIFTTTINLEEYTL